MEDDELEDALLEESHNFRDRERLRPIYGDKVDDFDYGDIDEFIGMLNEFAETHGEPTEPAQILAFMEWFIEENRKMQEQLRQILRRNT